MKRPVEGLSGVAAITITPFTPDLEIDEAELRRIVQFMDQGGADSIFACGGLAEYYALRPEEKRLIVRATVESAREAAVFASVGLDVDNAVSEARAAAEEGVDGLMIHPPPHPYVHPAGLAEYYRMICASTSLPVVAYIRDARLSAEELEPIIRIDNVVAVKYAVNDVRRFASLVDDLKGIGGVTWLCGIAEAWAPSFWLAGASGFTSGIANFAVRESVRLRDALDDGDLDRARPVWARLRQVEDLRATDDETNSIAVIKAATSLCGLTAVDAVRPPLRPLPAGRLDELKKLLSDWDVLLPARTA